jgi:hypothetical protein
MQLTLFASGGVAWADASGNWQERIGRDDALANADFEFGMRDGDVPTD